MNCNDDIQGVALDTSIQLAICSVGLTIGISDRYTVRAADCHVYHCPSSPVRCSKEEHRTPFVRNHLDAATVMLLIVVTRSLALKRGPNDPGVTNLP